MSKYQYEEPGQDVRGLPGIPTEDFLYERRSKVEHDRLRQAFSKGVKREFRRYLAEECRDELQAAGFSDGEIETFASGKSVKGFNIHHVHPLDDSGTNDFSNLVLMDMWSHSQLHRTLDPLLVNRRSAEVPLPVPPGHVYVHPSIARERLDALGMTLETVVPSDGAPAEEDAMGMGYSR
ncbi:HNH endonuclease signature motif containing protein [Telmatospirillum siberiense]|uniref:HNH endonuclease n=1 Tax=Telmatospirillum siberiense TaxID=382514 RepID=A0A2N3PNJ1_9PROT|nr:HNH endonuclease signature motif containing protein [Telmatospirillum siberiense]PKU21962.1 hypothetical protein CWS72_23960 [Telmatospirillum siberiense]